MDLKLSKKLKGKWEKKDGCCRVVDLNLYRNKRKLWFWKVPKYKKKNKQTKKKTKKTKKQKCYKYSVWHWELKKKKARTFVYLQKKES